MTSTDVNSRVQKHRDALRAAGLRPAQIWVIDTRRDEFMQACQLQSQIVAQATDDTQALIDDAWADLDGWA